MASPTVTEIAVGGASVDFSNAGYTIQRVFHVEGLPSDETALFVAATASGIPKYGSPHKKAKECVVQSINAVHLNNSRTQAIVRVTYSGLSIKITSSNGMVVYRTHRHEPGVLGDPLLVGYNENPKISFPAKILKPTNGKEGNKYAFVDFQVLSPGSVVEIERIESHDVLQKSIKFRRTVNSDVFQGQPPGTWLCRAVDADSRSAGRYFLVRYVIELDPQADWNNQVALFTDRDTGRTPQDIGPNIRKGNYNGYTKVAPYLARPFAELGLPNL